MIGYKETDDDNAFKFLKIVTDKKPESQKKVLVRATAMVNQNIES